MVRFVKVIEVRRFRGKPPLRCALSKASADALGKWITVSGKKRADYIFPGRRGRSSHPMTVRQMGRLLKLWVAEAGPVPNNVFFGPSVRVIPPGFPLIQNSTRVPTTCAFLFQCATYVRL